MEKMKQLRTKYTGLWMLLLSLPLIFASCESNVHDDEAGGMSVSLMWQNSADETTVSDIRLWIFNKADGALVKEQHYSDARTLAGERFQMDKGQYKVVAAVNLGAPISVSSPTNMDDLQFSLSSPDAATAQAFYGVADATVESTGGVTLVTDTLRRMLTAMTIIIDHAPESARLTGTVNHVATAFYPCRGELSTDTATVNIPETAAQDSTIHTAKFYLLPSANGQENTNISLQVTLPGGNVSQYIVKLPEMEAGGNALIWTDYQSMRPYMDLSTVTINPWEDKAHYNSEILNPDK